MRKVFGLILFITLLASSYPAQAQTYSLELGTALDIQAVFADNAAPRPIGYMSVLVGNQDNRSYTTVQLVPQAGRAAYVVKQGIERTLFNNGQWQLNTAVQGGIATSAALTSGAFAGGGSLVWTPPYLKGLRVVFGAEAVNAPAIETWEPEVKIGLRFTFSE